VGAKHFERIERWNYGIAGLAVLVGALLFERPIALGLAVGAVLSTVNLYTIRRLLTAVLRAESEKKKALLQTLLLAKMTVMIVAVYLALRFLPISPVGLAIGVSTFLVAIAVESLRFALRPAADPASNETNDQASR
jgi:hypothetical protein